MAPVLTLKRTCILGISTLKSGHAGKESWYNDFIDQQIVPSYQVTYTCPACQAIGITLECKHYAHRKPKYLGSTNAVTDYFSKDVQYQAEIAGTHGGDDVDQCFPSHLLERFFSNPKTRLYKPIPWVVVAIDPCSGTDVGHNTSDFAIVSVAPANGITLLGIDGIGGTRHDAWEKALIAHLNGLRNLDGCQKSLLVFDIEANGSASWSYLVSLIRKHFRSVVFLSDFKNKEATNTTHALKKDALVKTLTALEDDNIAIHQSFVSATPTETLAEFETQMKAYKRHVKTSGERVVTTFSGKDKGAKDDLSFTFMRAVRSMFRYQQTRSHFIRD